MMNDTLRIHIPLTIRKRGGRPRILPSKEVEVEIERGQDPHVLRAVGLAWRWRQRIERGGVTTLADLAAKDCFSDRYVSRLERNEVCLNLGGFPVGWISDSTWELGCGGQLS